MFYCWDAASVFMSMVITLKNTIHFPLKSVKWPLRMRSMRPKGRETVI